MEQHVEGAEGSSKTGKCWPPGRCGQRRSQGSGERVSPGNDRDHRVLP